MIYQGEEDEIARCMANEGQYAVQHAVATDPSAEGPMIGTERGIKYEIVGFTQWKRTTNLVRTLQEHERIIP